MQRTLSIIKPDAVSRNLSGEILAIIQKAGFRVVGMKMLHLSKKQAEEFYAVHKNHPFFDGLTTYMCSDAVICMVLESEDAIARYRKLIGVANPEQADKGTIRKTFALSKEANSVHGSDSPESASWEISYFFSKMELFG